MNIFLIIIVLVLITTMVTYFKGKDGSRSIVVYEDWNDSNFWSAVLILLIVIPMINNLVINKNQGSKINSFAWMSKRTHFTRLA